MFRIGQPNRWIIHHCGSFQKSSDGFPRLQPKDDPICDTIRLGEPWGNALDLRNPQPMGEQPIIFILFWNCNEKRGETSIILLGTKILNVCFFKIVRKKSHGSFMYRNSTSHSGDPVLFYDLLGKLWGWMGWRSL